MTKRVGVEASVLSKQLLTAIVEDTLEAGGLFDLNIEVLPTEDSSIVRVLCEQTFPM